MAAVKKKKEFYFLQPQVDLLDIKPKIWLYNKKEAKFPASTDLLWKMGF